MDMLREIEVAKRCTGGQSHFATLPP